MAHPWLKLAIKYIHASKAKHCASYLCRRRAEVFTFTRACSLTSRWCFGRQPTNICSSRCLHLIAWLVIKLNNRITCSCIDIRSWLLMNVVRFRWRTKSERSKESSCHCEQTTDHGLLPLHNRWHIWRLTRRSRWVTIRISYSMMIFKIVVMLKTIKFMHKNLILWRYWQKIYNFIFVTICLLLRFWQWGVWYVTLFDPISTTDNLKLIPIDIEATHKHKQ